MNRSPAFRHLFWKETRQVLPLVWMQLGLGVFLQWLFLFPRADTFTLRLFAFGGMPSLFALGVGALLVGQEKELRTLDWLRWLPVSPGDVWRVKLAVASLSLLAVWGLNLLVLVIVWLPAGKSIRLDAWFDTGGWQYVWMLQSVYFLVAGFATAWFFRSTLISLLALVPLAILPGMLGPALLNMGQHFRWTRPVGVAWEPAVTAVVMVALGWVLLLLAWRWGRKGLAADDVVTRRRVWQVGTLAPGDDPPLWTQPVYEPVAMLVWQFLRQNHLVLRWIVALLLGALVLRHAQEVSVPLILLATSWLGVLAFQGDALQERIRFLAERGVSPAMVWWTRHAAPLSLLTLYLFLFFLLLPDASFDGHRLGLRALPPLVLVGVAGVLFVYGVSQAAGMAIRSATLAAVMAPVLGGVLAAYGLLLLTEFGTPAEVLGLLGLMPWLLTFALMRRWMDHRLGWGFWSPVAGVLAFGLVGPLLPLGWDMARQPGMPAEVRQQLWMEAEAAMRTDTIAPRELRISYRELERNGPPGAVCHRTELEAILEQFEQGLSGDSRPVRFEYAKMRILLGEVRLARMGLEQEPESESQRRRYRRVMDLLGTLVERLRLSGRLIDQDGADLSEICLVNELLCGEAESWLGGERYVRLVQVVGDESGRNAARRRALLISWAAYRDGFRRATSQTLQLGGYSWRGQSPSMLYAANPYIRRRAADYLTWRMLERLEHPDYSLDPARIRELADYWQVHPLCYGLGLGGRFLRANDPRILALPAGKPLPRAPGGQWHAGWEQRGRELLDDLDEDRNNR